VTRSRKLFSMLVASVLVGGLVAVAEPVQAAAATYDLQVGAGYGVGGTNCNPSTGKSCQAFGESFRYMPGTVNVAKGDEIHFNFQGFHTATALPAGTDSSSWVASNDSGIGEPFNPVSPDPDPDLANGPKDDTKFNNAVFFPSDPSCGGAAGSPCSVDGTKIVNSGAPLSSNDYYVTIDANVGTSLTFLCLIHTGMRLQVSVANPSDVTDPSTLAAQQQQQVADDQKAATALHNKYWNRHTHHPGPNGTTVWDAWPGIDTQYIGLDQMYPHVIHAHKGDRVRWHFEKLVNNHHSVTFPRKVASRLSNTELGFPVCDPDGDSGPGPDTQPTQPAPPFCSDPTQLEIDVSNAAGQPAGNHAVTSPTDFESSGVRAGTTSNNWGPARAYQDQFTRINTTGFTYACNVHGGFMSGKVVVTHR